MANIQPVTPNAHANKRWQRFSSFGFAAQSVIVPLMLTEVRSAASAFPIGFLKHENSIVPAAILGLNAGSNVFVDNQGRWMGAYTPAAFRAWPFSIAYSEKGEKLLCVDEDSGLVTDGPDGETFFKEDGTPSEALEGVLRFLARFTQDRDPSLAACSALQAAGVLEPWNAVVRTPTREWTMDGFLRINEDALNNVRTAVLSTLHKSGALSLAYSQLHAMAHLPLLARLAEERLLAQGSATAPQAG
ncbi:SapC family protein [Thauera propionica]|uniref:SapC family protein n=1 Tax=Thauera propionica TaxID=2019431 RepID=UPI0023EF7136|nr:SapC family protein [Thauera propionica]MDD3676834.1 SapC family protein [Thauera propionica]